MALSEMAGSARWRVVILGRPNVGKSTLFNRLAGRRLALVDDQPGVTRDRREASARLADLDFTIVDTAGLEEAEAESLEGRMRRQTEAALDGAAVALFVVDARTGLTEGDRLFARWLREASPAPILLVANKAEGRAGEAGWLEAQELGLGEPIALSAEHGEGLAELHAALAPVLDAAASAVDADEAASVDEAGRPLKLAIVGRPNAGKSTLVNALLGEQRVLTGPEAGITRDAITIPFVHRGRAVELVDTAGLRRQAKIADPLEQLAAADARRAVDFAEVVVLLLDATRGLEAQDLRIADRVLAEGRALLVAVNKWDVAEDRSRLFNGLRQALAEGLAQVRGLPLLAVSALERRGLDELVDAAFVQRERWSRRLSTGRLNRWLEAAIERHPPPAPGGRRIRLRYITQVSARPPSFVLFGGRLDAVPDSYRRYLVHRLAEDFDLGGLPIRLELRERANPYAGDERAR